MLIEIKLNTRVKRLAFTVIVTLLITFVPYYLTLLVDPFFFHDEKNCIKTEPVFLIWLTGLFVILCLILALFLLSWPISSVYKWIVAGD